MPDERNTPVPPPNSASSGRGPRGQQQDGATAKKLRPTSSLFP